MNRAVEPPPLFHYDRDNLMDAQASIGLAPESRVTQYHTQLCRM